MSVETIHVEPIKVLPPDRIGRKPEPKGAPVIEEPPPLAAPAGYPYDLSVPRIKAYANAPDFIWHKGQGLVIDTYA